MLYIGRSVWENNDTSFPHAAPVQVHVATVGIVPGDLRFP